MARMLNLSRDIIRPTLKSVERVTVRHGLVPQLRYDSLELDELMLRFRYKHRNRHLWLAVRRLTCRVLAYAIWDRSRRIRRWLWQRIPPASRHTAVYTDEYPVYGAVLRPWQHPPSLKGSRLMRVTEGLNNGRRTRVAHLARTTVCVQRLDDQERRLQVVSPSTTARAEEGLGGADGWVLASTCYSPIPDILLRCFTFVTQPVRRS
jgi:IS1 family transposase